MNLEFTTLYQDDIDELKATIGISTKFHPFYAKPSIILMNVRCV